MRTLPGVLALGLLAGLAPLTFHASLAADPSTSQIINSLTPGSGGMTTRGIRLGGPSDQSGPAHNASTGGSSSGGGHAAASDAGAPKANLSVPFATGSATFSPNATVILNRLGDALTSPALAQSKFRVEGHTDTVGSPDSNKTLSEQRAAAVVDFLVSKRGIDKGRLTAVGKGQDELLVPTGPGVSSSQNRRVVVVNVGA